jgi:hypothetical protein
MSRSEVRRLRGWPTDVTGAALAFLFEVVIVVGLAMVALVIAAVVTAVN